MKPIVHWISFEQRTSGLYTYTYSLHKATKELGYESHICYTNPDLKTGGTITLPNPAIGTVDFSPWDVSKDAINFTHDQLPHMKLDNWVTEFHGHPHFIAQDMDPLSVTAYKLGRVKLAFTRFPSHVQYWKQFTDTTPIHVIPPGVNLKFWNPNGPVSPFFQRPIVLWADTVRAGVKSPINLLYAMKIVNKELPLWGLKLVALIPEEIAGYAYLCGRLGLDSIVEWPLEAMHAKMVQLYRAVVASGGLMYSDTNEEGSNSSWEAEACGLPVIHHRDSPEEIAQAIIEASKNRSKPVVRDIRETAKKMVEVLEASF